MPRRAGYLLDSSVLIDYAVADLSILELVSRHVAPVYLALPLLEEVEQVSRADCERLGIVLTEPTLEQLVAAGQARGGALSFQDRLCVALAAAAGWTCVSNDRALRAKCVQADVPVVWGLELMVELVARQELLASQAILVSRAIAKGNPRFTTERVLRQFAERVRSPRR